MNIKEKYGVEIANLLKKYKGEGKPLAEKGLFLFENLLENELLFIGINPSEVKDLTKKYGVEYEDGIYWGNKKFRDEYPYYRKFDDLANNGKWSHLDLFFTLEKTMKNLRKEVEQKNRFLAEQFEISKKIIQKLEPKLIVVGNAYASHLIKDRCHCNFDDTIGTYRIKEYNNVPIFFSGMFAGSHPLDVGSRERLKWHIGFVKQKIGF